MHAIFTLFYVLGQCLKTRKHNNAVPSHVQVLSSITQVVPRSSEASCPPPVVSGRKYCKMAGICICCDLKAMAQIYGQSPLPKPYSAEKNLGQDRNIVCQNHNNHKCRCCCQLGFSTSSSPPLSSRLQLLGAPPPSRSGRHVLENVSRRPLPVDS